jgi:hypothetical protein
MPDFKNTPTVNGTKLKKEIQDGRAVQDGGVIHYIIPGLDIAAVGTRSLTANRIYYCPILPRTAITIDQIAIEVTTAAAASSLGRLGFYNADTGWQPTSLIYDAGEIAIDSTGVKTIALGAAQTLQPGRYLLAYFGNGAPTLRSARCGAIFTGAEPGLGANFIRATLYASLTYTTFPSTGAVWTNGNSNASGFDQLIFCRVSVP